MKHKARKEGSRFHFDDGVGWQADLEKLGDRDVTVEVRKYFPQRSNPQNNYFHGAFLDAILDQWAESPLTVMFGELEITPDADMIKSLLKTAYKIDKTSDLTTAEFEDFLSRARQDLSTKGIYVPEPNEGPLLSSSQDFSDLSS